MPTGYTSAVVDGNVTDLRTFALDCARAFGACASLRDEGGGGENIPEEFQPSVWTKNALGDAERDLANHEAIPAESWDERAEAQYRRTLAEQESYLSARAGEDERLDAMEAKVLAWECPEALRPLRAFMLEQIGVSRHGSWRPTPPVRVTGVEWHATRLADLRERVASAREDWRRECERAQRNTAWVKALRESLPAPVPA